MYTGKAKKEVPAAPFAFPGDSVEGYKERNARAEAEALEILTLIDEYHALPEALPYVERNK